MQIYPPRTTINNYIIKHNIFNYSRDRGIVYGSLHSKTSVYRQSLVRYNKINTLCLLFILRHLEEVLRRVSINNEQVIVNDIYIALNRLLAI